MTEETERIQGDLPEIPPTDKCNARNKAHTKYCQNPAGYKTDHLGDGRCIYHGGGSKRGIQHHNFRTGKYSTALPDRLLPKYEELMQDQKWLELREEVHLMTLMIFESWEDIRDNYHSSREYFQAMKRQFGTIDLLTSRYGDDIPEPLVSELKELKNIFKDAQKEHHKRAELMTMMDQKRKLTESERKRLLEAHSLFSAEQMMTLMAGVLSIIRENVPEIDRQEKIQAGIRKLMNKAGAQSTEDQSWNEDE